ncbi:glucose 1-dehydrogenase [Caldibacillus debilis]|uniref:glucose 1-dehydrogenase n=1 Tax=Caldibacillus debilis TaxID=301148 RepID=UPI000E39EF97|nr:glucose 1-dehydrogenase [Caldibacillus debilis]REJ26425.1 MAG: 3-alpha-hydroxysteroid dehydrogenase [Caldibacillus debilis]
MGRFDGKVVLISGGARGQGASHARKFVEEGAKVVFTDILVEEGEALEKELGKNAKFLKHDVRSAADWEKVVSETEKTFGPINVLVNNAGIVISKKLEELSEEEYRRVIDINQVSVFLGMKAVIPSMKKAKGGSIINISSINGLRGSVGTFAYDASKFAVRGMTKTAALELAEYGIRVNSIHPGIINTPMVMQDDVKDTVGTLANNVPLKRIGQPEDVSNLVLFLASDESSYSTGSEFVIDGGLTAKY